MIRVRRQSLSTSFRNREASKVVHSLSFSKSFSLTGNLSRIRPTKKEGAAHQDHETFALQICSLISPYGNPNEYMYSDPSACR
jgi:hypothetical protein